MTSLHSGGQASETRLRLRPAVILAAVQWIAWLIVPLLFAESGGAIVGLLVSLACGLGVVVWWLFFSRASWPERLGALGAILVAVGVTSRLVHPSVGNGMMGMMLPMYAVPVMSLALVVWAVAGRGLSTGRRYALFVVILAVACAGFTAVRTEGITGEGRSELRWRWTPTPEERLLTQASNERLVPPRAESAAPAPAPAAPGAPQDTRAKLPERPQAVAPAAAAAPDLSVAAPAAAPSPDAPAHEVSAPPAPTARAEWPGFRGPARDGVVRGVRIATDWIARPPVELWRRAVGPGWSSFAVSGGLIYTQEQRGEYEVVSCYRLTTGEPVWRHRDSIRFWESNGGAGPRATPTVANGRLYTMGATGILNALDAATGSLIWSRNTVADTGKTIPDWGIASSPLAVDDVVVAAVAGQLVGYDAGTGRRRWLGPAGGGGYSSPHLLTIDGVPQVVLLRGSRTVSIAPADGTLLWEHTAEPGVGIVQPALAEGDVLLSNAEGMGGSGIRRIAVTRRTGTWGVEERWSSRGLKPYFNDFVVHEGHAYGFDGSILAAVNLGSGERAWKGGRYGHGQLLLLAEQGVLLILAESGELALVAASPEKFTELARVPALEDKTWNHPVLVGDVLLVRNGQEMAAFRLPPARESAKGTER